MISKFPFYTYEKFHIFLKFGNFWIENTVTGNLLTFLNLAFDAIW